MKPEFLAVGEGERESRGGGGHLGTYQRSHPLKEVDALPVIDVVGLPALPGHQKRAQSGTCLLHLQTAPSSHPGPRPGQCPFSSGADQLCDPMESLNLNFFVFLSGSPSEKWELLDCYKDEKCMSHA